MQFLQGALEKARNKGSAHARRTTQYERTGFPEGRSTCKYGYGVKSGWVDRKQSMGGPIDFLFVKSYLKMAGEWKFF